MQVRDPLQLQQAEDRVADPRPVADKPLPASHQPLRVLLLDRRDPNPGQGLRLAPVPGRQGPDHPLRVDPVRLRRLRPANDLQTGRVAHHHVDAPPLAAAEPAGQPETLVTGLVCQQHPLRIAGTGAGLPDLRDKAIRVGRRQRVHGNPAGILRIADPDDPCLVAHFHRHVQRASFAPGRGHVIHVIRHVRLLSLARGRRKRAPCPNMLWMDCSRETNQPQAKIPTRLMASICMTEILQPYIVPRPRPATRRDSLQEHSRTHRDDPKSR